MRIDTPMLLGPNQPSQAYPGGGRGARFRGLDAQGSPEPEDWIASVTARWGQAPSGLSVLEDGTTLKDAIEAEPEAFLGPDHVAAFGADPFLLVKLLDSAERLVVHCHPDRSFAQAHLGCAHGKTEAWLVLEAEPGAEVYLTFRREVARDELGDWVSRQDVDRMLEALHPIAVQPGSAVLVPAGVPHAIGAGILLVELQEPTDFSVMLEQGRFQGGDLGLGFDVALGCVDRAAWSLERLSHLLGPGLGQHGAVLPGAADPFFRAEHLLGSASDRIAGFGVLVVVDGVGELAGEFPGRPLPLRRGATVLVPYAAGPMELRGDVEGIWCRPPAPDAPRPARPEV
ncbi:MAG: class I mannose-6-phosphate isomerase [Actinomycetota bacterium]|nr:class I mannose-6-phosphate isomerase [Actinomycetota bacterium]